MASRREQKARLKGERERKQAERRRAERRRRTVIVIVVGVLVVAAVVATAVLVTSGGGKGEGVEIVGQEQVSQELGGVDQKASLLGKSDAPVTIREFGDLQCPACKQASETLVPQLIDEYVKPGKARFDFTAIAILGEDSKKAAEAAIAAGIQNKEWTFVELFYDNQGQENTGYVTDDFLEAVASKAGLDVDKFNGDRSGSQAVKGLEDNMTVAQESDVQSTPTFQVEGPGGKITLLPEENTIEDIGKAVDKASEKGGSKRKGS